MSVHKNTPFVHYKENFHLIPGRLRVSIPGLMNNQDIANMIAHRLAQFTGIRLSYANPITGQVLVYFDPPRTDLGYLLSWFSHAGHKGVGMSSPIFPPAERKVSTKHHMNNKDSRKIGPPIHDNCIPWHTQDAYRALVLLDSSAETGLSQRKARDRLAVFGPNELLERPPLSFWQIALGTLRGFMTKLLLVAGGVSLLVGESTDAFVIVAIVFLQAIVEGVQGCRAQRSLSSLKELTIPQVTVFREGRLFRVSGKELVPGDILHLDSGDVVPADALIIEATNLTTNEACLTGESIPVVKDGLRRGDSHILVADQTNMLFSGTSITGGRVSAVVVATGMQTQMGQIACLLNDVYSGQTNLQRQLEDLGKKVTFLVVVSVGTIALISLLRGHSIWQVLRNGISLAVGAVPEGLPAVLTVALTAGMHRMVKRNAVVRDISAVESLGSTTVICTDKTGTLTKNEMTAKELYIAPNFYELTGDGYRPRGEILPRGDAVLEETLPLVIKTLEAGVLCNNAELKLTSGGKWEVVGDPTEGALLTAAGKVGLCWQSLRGAYCRRREIAFAASHRRMTVVCQEPDGGYGVYVKGAPDTVIDYCTTVIGNSRPRALDLKIRRRILAVNDSMSKKGLRVLSIAYKKLPDGSDLMAEDIESDLTFCGLIGMADPLRPGVEEAIVKCHRAGIKVVMITGDHQRTAEAIAEKLGILNRGISINGRELQQLSDGELSDQVGNITVFSRTSPEQKLRIVRALKGRGQIVAMTGDGINDAPAIKEADIGIAMGLSGTDVTRGAANITLSDDNFVTIVNGIEEGRTVGVNLSKSVGYILSGSLGQLMAVFCSTVLGLPAPMLPSQILWVNLVTESLPAMAFTADPPEVDHMNRPPLKIEDRFLPDQGRALIRKGMLSGLTGFGLYAAGLTWGGWSLQKARTMAFSQLVVNRVFDLLNGRKGKHRNTAAGGGNQLLLPAAALSVFALATTMYLPFMRPLFSTVPIGLKDWALLITNSFLASNIDSRLKSENEGGQRPPIKLPPTNSEGTAVKGYLQ